MSEVLTRAYGRPKAPVRIVHLGLGNFFRAHLCWYTEHAADADAWGIAAFSGRGSTHVDDLRRQDDLYTLLVQGQDSTAEVVSALSRVYPAADLAAWRDCFASPSVELVTSTVTEGGYLRDAQGRLDLTLPAVRADLAALRADPRHGVVATAPGKFVAGLLARRAAGAGRITFLPCDNVVESGAMARDVVSALAAAVDPALMDWIGENVSFVSAVVDRITPGTRQADRLAAAAMTGCYDPALVVTEAFSEWVIQGHFLGQRPDWESAGARVVDDIRPFESRKLWLLNGAHSLMAYCGPLLGHQTVQGAILDPVIRGWVEDWWAEAGPQLALPATEVRQYCAALLDRFANPSLTDALSRIAADGSQKLPIRILPVVRIGLAGGGIGGEAGLRVIAAWILHLRGLATPVNDVRQATVLELGAGTLADAVAKTVAFLGLPDQAADQVLGLAEDLAATRRRQADGGLN